MAQVAERQQILVVDDEASIVDAVATALLRLVKRLIGTVQELIGGIVAAIRLGDSYRNCNV